MEIDNVKKKIRSYVNKDNLKRVARRARFLLSAPLIAGIVIIVCVGFGVVYVQHHREQDDLNSQLAITSAALETPAKDVNALQAEYDLRSAELEQIVDAFPGDMVDTEIIAAALQTAGYVSTNITFSEWEVKAPVDRTVGDNTYLAFPFTIKAQGSVQELLNFIESMEYQSDVLATLVFESASIKGLGSSGGSATLSFSVYAHS